MHGKYVCARIVLSLARLMPKHQSSRFMNANGNSAGPASILLADDDPGVRETLGRVLESEGYRVLLAKTGREAVTQCRTDPPDLVLLDLNMPVMDGWAAFRMMNQTDPMRPVVV